MPVNHFGLMLTPIFLMRFVHVIQINDPQSSLLKALTREQVWRGLMRRAERPMDFLPQLHACNIVVRGDRLLMRELNFGAFVVRDRVRFTPQQALTFDTDSAPNIVAARLCIAIEASGDDQLQLRFTYDVERKRSDDVQLEAQYDTFTQAAYLQADIDSVRTMRALLAQEAL
jgi:Domain of unknown function (DUF1857)